MKVNLTTSYDTFLETKPAFGDNNTSSKTVKPVNNFTQKVVNKSRANINELKRDDEKLYSTVGTVIGLGVLAGIGVALLNSENIIKFINLKKQRKIANYARKHRITPHGGPEIDWSKGKKAIADSWNEYIKGIKTRRSEHDVIAKEYKQLFKENAEKLDILEKLCDERIAKRSKRFFK